MFYTTAGSTKTNTEITVQPEIINDTLKQLPITFPVQEDLTEQTSLLWIIIGAALLGILIGLVFGLFQWISIRRHSSRATAWVAANAIGWGFAMIWIFLAATLPDEHTPIPFW